MDSPGRSLAAIGDAFEHAACGLLTTSADGTIVRVNTTFCRWVGYRADELLERRRVQDLLTVGGKVFHQTHWAPLLQIQRSVAEVKLDIRHRDGRKIPMLINAARRRHEDIEYDDFAFVVVTDRHKYEQELLLARQKSEQALEAKHAAEEALRLADRRKDEFLATLAHEIRNPLGPLRTVIEVFSRKTFDDPQVVWSRDVLERQIGHIAHLVDDLLEVSRIAEGKLELRTAVVDLSLVAMQAVETSRALIDASSHALKIELPEEPVILTADPTKVSQVIQNLLNNAAKYTPAGGTIWLSIGRDADEAVISVRDTGIGIAAEQLPSIFEIFAQLPPGHDRAQGGLGIGLSLVKALVERHGGNIEVNSEGTGLGSEFIVRLPIGIGQAAQGGSSMTIAVDGHRRQRVLIVDDNDDAATSLAMLLELDGHDTRTASDGITCLSVADIFDPETIILDIGLPGLDGYEVAGLIRKRPNGPSITLIALTGWAQPRDKESARSAGFDFHLSKPVDYDLLRNILTESVR
ncbi:MULTISPECIES: ATP-binding protein [unclassified Caballeronia]|uniref:hybrid sensor histidine kinase/response regulator n=1 Tax=unclassified Caballeronia TaxID=2646786 RepID=UPI00285F6D64|nr:MULTISPECIES: ATP-binding protein [unclassified Caballeronia]MDR5755003.1 ATP-binding protein [Caballeronia sp. LZ024]MDR5845565.1 ATP-binding protein [Caballeronia sp. LZ031]